MLEIRITHKNGDCDVFQDDFIEIKGKQFIGGTIINVNGKPTRFVHEIHFDKRKDLMEIHEYKED